MSTRIVGTNRSKLGVVKICSVALVSVSLDGKQEEVSKLTLQPQNHSASQRDPFQINRCISSPRDQTSESTYIGRARLFLSKRTRILNHS